MADRKRLNHEMLQGCCRPSYARDACVSSAQRAAEQFYFGGGGKKEIFWQGRINPASFSK
jgi:hypothetical protein